MQGDTLVRESCPNIEPVTYGAFYTGFAKALEGQMEVPVRPEGAREVIRLVELARLSSRERRTLNVRGKYEGID